MNNFNLHKYSLDLSHLKNDRDEGGAYGTFMNHFDEGQKKEIKDKMGLDANHIGIKQFGYPESLETVQENLALYFIKPYIEKNTNIKVPYAGSPINLSSLFLNQMVAVQKINGITLTNLNNQLPFSKRAVCDNVVNTLKGIGITWKDGHGSNIMVSSKTVEKLRNSSLKMSDDGKSQYTVPLDDIEIVAILLKDIHIVDFGAMYCSPGTEPYERLTKLKEKLQELKKQMPPNKVYLIRRICVAIQETQGNPF